MTTFKQVLVVIVMVIAVIGMAACLAGIIGGWVINAPLTHDATVALTGLSKTLEVANSAVTDASAGLGAARSLASQALGITTGAGDTLDQSKVNELATLVQGKLAAAVSTLTNAGRTIVGTVQAINDMVATLNRIPGVQISPLDSTEIEKVTGLITDVSGALDQVVGAIEQVRSGVANALTNLKQAVIGLDDRLRGLEALLDGIQPRIGKALDSVNALIPRVAGLIDTLSVVLTVVLLWLGFAQFGLFMWMRSLFRGLRTTGIGAKSE
jgi:hypothetical protein